MLAWSLGGKETSTGNRGGPLCSSLPLFLTAVNKETSKTDSLGVR